MRLRILRAAEADLDRIGAFLERDDPEIAIAALRCINDAAQKLLIFPHRAPFVDRRSFRRLSIPFGRAAYLLDYRVSIERQTVTILRIRHSREAR